MSQFYSDPERESNPHALPDCEAFWADCEALWGDEPCDPGWYWRACFPGCLPDGEPIGPFESEEEAIADARKLCDYVEDEDT